MQLDSARNLKREVLDRYFAPVAVAATFKLAAAPARSDPPKAVPTFAVGVAPKGKAYQLALRLQDRALERSSIVDDIRKQAKGEIDVAYIGRVEKRAWHRERNRPLLIGGSVGHFNITAGTVGAFVQGKSAEETYILSNNHVLADEGAAAVEDAVWQPGKLDGGKKADLVARFTKTVALRKSGANLVDAAIAKMVSGIEYDGVTLKGIGKLVGVRSDPIDEGLVVHKVGRTTGVTKGRVTVFEVAGLCAYFRLGVRQSNNVPEIGGAGGDPFSAGGDSGSIIVDRTESGECRAVALLFAGGDTGGTNGKGLTYANPIDEAFKRLRAQLRLDAGTAVSWCRGRGGRTDPASVEQVHSTRAVGGDPPSDGLNCGVSMIALFASLVLSAGQPAVEELPKVREPDWNAWNDVAPEARKRAAEAWAVLVSFRAGREYNSAAERRDAERKVDEAYRILDGAPEAACATGAERIRAAKDDWERQMIGSTLAQSGDEKGEAVMIWAMANCTSLEDGFEPVWHYACFLAAKRRPEDLPALFLMLRTREGHVPLRRHAWFIRTHECLYYVFGRFGPGAVPYLRKMLGHDDAFVRRNAAMLLGWFGDVPSKAALLKVLDADDVGSGGAAFALGMMGVAEARAPMVKLLKNKDVRTRFWAAYGLYELGSKDALPDLEAALKVETDDGTRAEMRAAVTHLRAGPAPAAGAVRKLSRDDLKTVLDAALKHRGFSDVVDVIAASAGRADLERLEEIRLLTMDVPSDRGNKMFQRWTEIINAIRRRAD